VVASATLVAAVSELAGMVMLADPELSVVAAEV